MITVKNSTNMADLARDLGDIPARIIPYAASTALTHIAQQAAKQALPDEMRRVFDRPTPYALNSLFVVPSTVQTLSARVMVKNTAGRGVIPEKFLQPEVEGGKRSRKGFEKALQYKGILRAGESAMPSRDLSLDSFGNVPAGQIRSILSQVKTTSGKGKGRQIYAGAVGRKQTRGIWETQGRAIKPLFIFVKNAPSYKAIFNFAGVVEQLAKKQFAGLFADAAQKIARRAR